MKKKDDFDLFLKDRIQNATHTFDDDGFTEKVLRHLPKMRDYSIKRNIILYASALVSLILFVLLSGFKLLDLSIGEVINSSMHLIKPSITSIVIIITFLSIIGFISSLEYNRNTI